MKTTKALIVSPLVSIMDRPLRILHVEDNGRDRYLIQEWLREQNIAAEFTEVDNEADFIKAFEQEPFDIILSDKSLPGFDGLTALRYVRKNHPHIPFIFVTGSMGEEAAIETIKDGATDYVLKNRLSRLIPAMQRAIRESEQKEENRQIEDKNREQAALLDKAQDAIMVKDVEDHIMYWNKSAERIYGWPAAAVLGRKAMEFLPKDASKYEEAKELLLENENWTGELVKVNRGGNELIIEGRWILVRDDLGNPKSILIIDTDITAKKALEAKFLRSQRLDTIGALAGGIAHDLNNALAPVIMGAELLRSCEETTDREKFLDIIISNAQRATGLVKQILSFARGSGGKTSPVQLTHLIGEIGNMIHDTFPKSVHFSVKTAGKELWMVLGDITEIYQVLMNLCVNARDAMPQGGQLSLSAQNFHLSAEMANSCDAKPGPYVMISVTDTGTGIPPEVLPRIFEPFFTTKPGDKGTGLGLSTVSGIIKSHRGFIDIHTQAGKGTEFKVYFPAIPAAGSATEKNIEVDLPVGAGELILLIDDEEALVEMTKTILETFGYHALTAHNGLQGIERFTDHQNEIRLVITDSDMPYMDGMGAIHAIRELKPDLPIIITSGSKEDTTPPRKADADLKRLGKPYSVDQLLNAVNLAIHR